MSESYTIGGDTWQPLAGFDISGQTITPLESHIVTFIDLNLWLFGYTPPLVYISECDSSHEPIPPILSDAHTIEPLIYLPPVKARVRFQLDTPVLLEKGHIYAIRFRKAIDHAGPNNQVLYDKDDATYPRGHVIFSDDGGNTWTHFNGHDFIFTEFGDPPLLKPTPVPPISYFATLDINYHPYNSGILINLPTSVPCHLTAYYTGTKPRKHHTERIVRGLAVPWGTYFCFVAWQEAEQIEPGDTLYHSFFIPDWAYCQTKWITFRGEVDELESPSIGPIFEKHYNFKIYEHLNVSYAAYWGSTGPDNWAAQTFTSPRPHTIVSIRLPLHRTGNPGIITASIRATDGAGHPTGPDITTGTIDGNTLPTTHPGEWRFFSLTHHLLPVATKYAIVLRSEQASVLWPHVGGNQYPSGQLLTSGDAGVTWNPTGRDFIFECWGTPA